MKILIGLLLLIALNSKLFAFDSSTVLITGANRGIGLEYAKQFTEKGYKVIGTARNPEKAKDLKALGVKVLQLDVTDAESVTSLAKILEGKPIDILINNAGYFDRGDVTLDGVDFDMFERTMAINTLGPLRVIKALIGNLSASKGKTVINMSSGLGSIEQSRGRWYAYRSSKTALNQINKILSSEYQNKGFIFTVLHPGWVRTDMGGSNATYSVEESVAGLVKVIEGLDKDDNGKFYDFQGKSIPW